MAHDEDEAGTLKERGNAAFAAGRFEEALVSYTLAIEKQTDPIEKAKNYSNRSACLCNLGRYEKAAEDGGMCIQLHPTWPKGHYRMAEALFLMWSPCVAIVPAMDAYTLDIGNAETKALVRALADKISSDPSSFAYNDLPDSPVQPSDRYRCKWTADDERAAWLALDAREQQQRSPARTCAHCLELGMASGMFTPDVMKAWEGSGMLLIHMVGASSEFELSSRLEDLIHLLPWVREIEIVLVGFKWVEQQQPAQPTAGDARVPHGPPRPLGVVRVPDPGAPHPPGVLVTLSKRKFMEGRKMFIRGYCGDYHQFASAHAYLSPHFALLMQPGLETDYDAWAPSLAFMISKNIPTFVTGAAADGSRAHSAVIVQHLGGRVLVPPQTSRFPVVPGGGGGGGGAVRNHNVMAFQGCNLAVQHDIMNQPTTAANFASTKRQLRNIGVDVQDSGARIAAAAAASYPPPTRPAPPPTHPHDHAHCHAHRALPPPRADVALSAPPQQQQQHATVAVMGGIISGDGGGDPYGLPLDVPLPLRAETEQLVLRVLEASCPDALKGLSELPLDLAMTTIVEGVKKHMGPP